MSIAVQVRTLRGDQGEGAYRVAAVSGLLTGVAAATGTAGHIFAMRWAPPDATANTGADKRRRLLLQRLRARMTTIAGYTAAQEVGIDLVFARSFSASYTGGTAIDLATNTNTNKKRTSFPTSAMADMRIGNTGALTAGTQTLDTNPLARAMYSELAAGAAVPTGFVEISLTTDDLDGYPIVLAPNEGLVIRNAVAQGAGGTSRLVVEMDWLEVASY